MELVLIELPDRESLLGLGDQFPPKNSLFLKRLLVVGDPEIPGCSGQFSTPRIKLFSFPNYLRITFQMGGPSQFLKTGCDGYLLNKMEDMFPMLFSFYVEV